MNEIGVTNSGNYISDERMFYTIFKNVLHTGNASLSVVKERILYPRLVVEEFFECFRYSTEQLELDWFFRPIVQ